MITRFAPSPTGPLHLGHAFSAILAHDMARKQGGRFLLRIEDIDSPRSAPQWQRRILEDLAWLGLTWDGPVLRQSTRLPAYRAALHQLWARGLLYPCTCTRRDIAEAARAPQEGAAPTPGPDGLVYPGTCRPTHPPQAGAQLPQGRALRLHMARALDQLDHPRLTFTEDGTGPQGQTGQIAITAAQMQATVGDVVLARRDIGCSYHLAVVVDDAFQHITHVVRGEDLFAATAVHVLLQRLLNLPTPRYHHHRLIRDETGKRLAKRDDARALQKFRAEGHDPAAIRRMVGLTASMS